MRIPALTLSLPLLALGFAAAVPTTASAATSALNISMGYLFDSGGTADANKLSTDTLFMLVADVGGDGFDPVPANSWVGGTDVVVMVFDDEFKTATGGFDLASGTTEKGLFSRTLNIDLAQFGSSPGKINFALRWFPAFKGDAGLPVTGPGAGTSYGEFSRTTPLYGYDSWSLNLAGGASYTFDPLATSGLGGTDNAALGMANLVTVPEPSGVVLLLALGAVSTLTRRRKAA